MLVLLATVCLNIYLYVIIPKGFFPQQDTGRLIGNIQADQSISFQAMRVKLADFMTIVSSDPAVENVVGFTGGSQRNSGFMFVSLKPLSRAQGNRGSGDRAAARQTVQGTGRQPVPATGAGHSHRRPPEQRAVPVHAAGRRPRRTARPGSRRSALRSSELPELADVNTDQQDKGLQTSLVIDRDTAARLGVTPELDRRDA